MALNKQQMISLYQRRASGYDLTINFCDNFNAPIRGNN
jgi:hypothetical protein